MEATKSVRREGKMPRRFPSHLRKIALLLMEGIKSTEICQHLKVKVYAINRLRLWFKQRLHARNMLHGIILAIRRGVLPLGGDPKLLTELGIDRVDPQNIKRLNFSPRKAELMTLLMEGCEAKEIAAMMDIKAKTVDSHRIVIQDRLQANNATHTVVTACRTGFLPLGGNRNVIRRLKRERELEKQSA